jgi:hypothetical protein
MLFATPLLFLPRITGWLFPLFPLKSLILLEPFFLPPARDPSPEFKLDYSWLTILLFMVLELEPIPFIF